MSSLSGVGQDSTRLGKARASRQCAPPVSNGSAHVTGAAASIPDATMSLVDHLTVAWVADLPGRDLGHHNLQVRLVFAFDFSGWTASSGCGIPVGPAAVGPGGYQRRRRVPFVGHPRRSTGSCCGSRSGWPPALCWLARCGSTSCGRSSPGALPEGAPLRGGFVIPAAVLFVAGAVLAYLVLSRRWAFC